MGRSETDQRLLRIARLLRDAKPLLWNASEEGRGLLQQALLIASGDEARPVVELIAEREQDDE